MLNVNLNIPIYRAKKIDSDEYVFGKLIEDYGIGFYLQINKSLENICNTYGDYGFSTTDFEQIDITTLSIHFFDMLDSQGNKIFGSLSASGKGGDIMKNDEYYGIAKYYDCKFVVEYENCFDVINEGNFEIIGIQE